MSKEDILATIRDTLGDSVVDVYEKNPRRSYVEVKPEAVPRASELIFRQLGGRFQIATGVDTPDAIEILYHWAFDRHGIIVTVRTKLDRDKPEIESLASICVATEWIEREMWELLGITFRNHPDLRHLLLADEWPKGKYPLRRDYVKDN